jgi:hypothetical protein
MLTVYPAQPSERRFAGILLTVLVHAVLILGWQLARHLPSPEPLGAERPGVQWLQLPARVAPAAQPPKRIPLPVPAHPRAAAPSSTPVLPPAQAAPSASAPTAVAVGDPAAPPSPAPAAPVTAAEILQRARRELGTIDRALREENRPYLVAPPDSPQIRMRNGIEQAAEMAPNRLWEAPKVQELVNNTGDGARRTRVITGGGSYCVTDRSPATGIDMIEKHGKQRITNCPAHEEAAKPQAWRTARDVLIDAR